MNIVKSKYQSPTMEVIKLRSIPMLEDPSDTGQGGGGAAPRYIEEGEF